MLLPQLLLFCVVGVTTTVVDFAMFNLLTRSAVAWRRIPANTVSVATAMLWSFWANWLVVFQPAGHKWLGRAGRFLVTTTFSAFVLQNVILFLTTYVWKRPANLAPASVRKLCPSCRLADDAVTRNCGIFAGTSFSSMRRRQDGRTLDPPRQ